MKTTDYEKLISEIETTSKEISTIELIKQFRYQQNKIAIDPMEFAERVCYLGDVTWDDVISKSRKHELVVARQLILVGFVEVFKIKLSKAASMINRNHDIYYHSLKTVQNMYATDIEYRDKFSEIFDKYQSILEVKIFREYAKKHIK